MPTYSEDRFSALKEQLEEDEANFDRQAREAQAKKKAVIEKLLRLERGLPSPDSCLHCWVEDGIDSRFVADRSDDPAN